MQQYFEYKKFVFLDSEYTSTHAKTTLISIGLVTLEGEELYITLNDYDRDQVSDWVLENVFRHIDESKSITSHEACDKVSNFFKNYSNGEKISIVSAGKNLDQILLFQLWHTKFSKLKYFSFERFLPHYLRHRSHFDLDTIFFMKGLNPDKIIREEFAGSPVEESIKKHNALYDAKIVRHCFLKLMGD
jgi:DNA polymerase III epsilon subunit-like protein